MLVVTTENVPGYRVREVKGQVFGVVVRSRGLAGNVMAGLRSLVLGGGWQWTAAAGQGAVADDLIEHAADRGHESGLKMTTGTPGPVVRMWAANSLREW